MISLPQNYFAKLKLIVYTLKHLRNAAADCGEEAIRVGGVRSVLAILPTVASRK